jgi:hypothetical protein
MVTKGDSESRIGGCKEQEKNRKSGEDDDQETDEEAATGTF